MKRYGYLYEKIVDVENCKKAIIETAKHKHRRNYVTEVLTNVDKYSIDLSNRLKNLDFTSPYREKEIEDGLSHKKRIIQIPKFYPDQCAHHAIVQVLQPYFRNSFYYWSCSNIKGKGIDFASKGMERVTKGKGIKYCLKLDIKKFYPSVDNRILKTFIRKKVKDNKALEIIDRIIDTSNGLPIGNYTSPFFAEIYLRPLDCFIKSNLHIKHYIRYADDMVLMGNNKRKLHNAFNKINKFVKDELNMDIKSNYQLFRVAKDGKYRKIDFIGRCYANGYTTIRKRRALALMKQSRTIKKLQYRNIPLNYHMCASFISRASAFKHTNSYAMKIKYFYSIDINKLKDVIRREQCGKLQKVQLNLKY